MNNQCFSNLIKSPACFKSAIGSIFHLFLTTDKYLSKKTNSFQTCISDHQRLIATVLKTTYEKFSPKLLTFRSCKHSWNDFLKNKFKSEAYTIQSGDTGSVKLQLQKV